MQFIGFQAILFSPRAVYEGNKTMTSFYLGRETNLSFGNGQHIPLTPQCASTLVTFPRALPIPVTLKSQIFKVPWGL